MDMTMQRNINADLMRWMHAGSRKPLIIRGARQVGKTYTVKEFGKNNFINCVVLDFERDRSVHSVFQKDLKPDKIVQELEIYTESRIVPGKTLLFFDEIQACERALMSLRYFYEEMPGLHVLAAGSLLEFAMDFISFPVGRVTFEWMRPMTFKEFLQAAGKEILAENIPGMFEEKSVPHVAHQAIMEQLRAYCIVGGMPQAVQAFIATGSLTEVKKIHDDILQSYVQSLVKYNAKAHIESLEYVMTTVPAQVGSQIKYTHLDRDRRIEVTKTSLKILEKALLVHVIHSTHASGLPLGAGAHAKIFKPLFLDIGLMQHICGLDPKESLSAADLTGIYRGAIAEQFVGQELLAAGGSENNKLYYWSRLKKGSSAEVDFVIARNGKIIPIEVKSGSAGRMRSLHVFFAENPHVEKGYVLSSTTHERQVVDKCLFLPLYLGWG
ncbi:MAG: DUF4143 domain-containing protein [Deltaproteobacteria bacterium]|nr:DUF4143 domain-containing protein [Deltaproteobacteria bacterium]